MSDLTLKKKSKLDLLAWYLLVMGFISILAAGLFFYLHRVGKLRYEDFTINGLALGQYFLFGGISSYLIGRSLSHYLRWKSSRVEKESSKESVS